MIIRTDPVINCSSYSIFWSFKIELCSVVSSNAISGSVFFNFIRFVRKQRSVYYIAINRNLYCSAMTWERIRIFVRHWVVLNIIDEIKTVCHSIISPIHNKITIRLVLGCPTTGIRFDIISTSYCRSDDTTGH